MTSIHSLALHDALPICARITEAIDLDDDDLVRLDDDDDTTVVRLFGKGSKERVVPLGRSEEHTSELQSRGQLVCRLLLEKKNNDILDSTNDELINHINR